MSINILNERYFYYKDPIGHGSFSTIFKGRNYKNDTDVAIKQIVKVVDKEQLKNEVENMKTFYHDNIIRFFDCIKMRREIYFILEYCNEGDLSQYISAGNDTFDNKFFFEIIEGLEYLYKKGILHRDIKPQNILIHDKTIKISDFGFAKSFEKNDLITTFCGSPLYMAPEIITSHEYSSLSDVWSLGVVLYELLCKEHPYKCNTKKELWEKFRNNNLKINFSIIESKFKKKFIENLLIINVSERLQWDILFRKMKFMRERSKSFIEENNRCEKIKLAHSPINILSSSIDIKICNENNCDNISRSAPNDISQHYIHNYINTNTLHRSDSIPKLGDSIPVNSPSTTSYLSQSIKSIRNLFWRK